MYGVTSTGFVKKTQQQVIDELQTAQRQDVDTSLTFGSDEPLTQINGIFSEHIAQLWELTEILALVDPDNASDWRLDQVSLFTGTRRDESTYSEVPVDCTFTGAASMTAGVQKVRHNSQSAIEFVVKEDTTIPGAGVYQITFRATNKGPIAAATGTLTEIVTPTAGWTTATNPEDADLGALTLNDAGLREKRVTELASGGGSSYPTLLSKLSKAGVTNITLLNNRTMSTVNGVPPKSVEAIVVGGDNAAIAQALYQYANAGCGFAGNTSELVTDSEGNTHEVLFTRPTVVDIYMEVVVETGVGYPGAAEHKLAIASKGNFKPGESVYWTRAICDAFVTGVTNVVSVEIGTTVSVSPADIDLDPRQIANYDTANILVNGA